MGSSQSNGDHYEIVVGKRLGSRSGKAFEGFELIEIPGDGMFLRGIVADQAGLHGVLAQIRDLGIPLLSVRRIDGHGAPMPSEEPEGADAAPGPSSGAIASDEAE
jgi:hypothetical protein